ncbi:MAG: mechanosensitive ion channel domain-containing protein [Ignavibacteriaceae bacterium]
MLKILIITSFIIFAASSLFAQTLDSTADNIIEDFLLHDTIYITKKETTFVAKPETIKISNKIEPEKDSSKNALDFKMVEPQEVRTDSTFFNFLEDIGSITLWTIFEIILIFLIGLLLIKLVDKLKKSPLARERLPFLQSLLVVLRAVIWITIFYIILTLLLGDTKEVLLIIIIVGIIIIGVSAIPLFRNFIGGAFISIVRPFEKGDYIKILGYYGEVQNIGWRSTKILSIENSLVFVPNSLFLTSSVENINIGQREQLITLEFEFTDEFETDYIISILNDAAISSPYTFNKKEAKVYLSRTDFVKNINHFKINLYLFDARFENELINSINTYVLNEIKKNKSQ